MRRIIAALLAALVVNPAAAQDTSDWTFTLTPYAWLMGASGNVSAKGQVADIDASFVDIVGKTDSLLGWMTNVEARRGKFGLYLDFVFTQFKASPSVTTLRNPLPGTSFSAGADATVKSSLIAVEGGMTYELGRWDATAIDVLAGLRYWHAAFDISVGASANLDVPGNVLDRSAHSTIARSGSMDWADPIVGLRLRHELAPHHRLQLRGDIGGFGIGSQITWQAFGGYAYEFSSDATSWSAVLGYRALSVKYTGDGGSHGRSLDLVLHGPVVGLTIRW